MNREDQERTPKRIGKGRAQASGSEDRTNRPAQSPKKGREDNPGKKRRSAKRRGEIRETSKVARERIKPVAPAIRIRVLEWFKKRGEYGGTDDELEQAFPELTGNTLRPRRNELVDSRDLRMAFDQRKTRAGRRAHVWVATWNDAPADSRRDAGG